MAGLPGAGLCGFFYILFILFLALREGFRHASDQPARWPEAAKLAIMGCVIALLMSGESWLLSNAGILGADLRALAPVYAMSNGVILVAVISSVHVLRVFFPRASTGRVSDGMSHTDVEPSHTASISNERREFEQVDL